MFAAARAFGVFCVLLPGTLPFCTLSKK